MRYRILRACNVGLRKYCSFTNGNGVYGPLEEIEHRLHRQDPISSLRHFLFTDPGQDDIGCAGSVEDVFEIYSKSDKSNYRKSCQAIATLFHLQKSFRNVMDISINNLYMQYSALNKFNKALHEETSFLSLVEDYHSLLPQIPLSITSFTFLCLSRLGVPFTAKVMNDMLLYFKDQFKDIDSESLSYIAVGIRYTVNCDLNFEIRPRIWWVLYLADALPTLRKNLEATIDSEELHKITITVFSLRTIMSNDLLQLYLNKVRQILLDPSLEVDGLLLQRIVKISAVVENILSQEENDFNLKESDLIPKLMMLLNGKLNLLRWVRLIRLSGILSRTNEGCSIIRDELLITLRNLYDDECLSNGSYSKLKIMTEMLKLENKSLSFEEWKSLTEEIMVKEEGPDFYFHVNDIIQMTSCINFDGEDEKLKFVSLINKACVTSKESDMLRFFGNFQLQKKYLSPLLLSSPELREVESAAVSRLRSTILDTYQVSRFINKFSYIMVYQTAFPLEMSTALKFQSMCPRIGIHDILKLSYSLNLALKKDYKVKSSSLKIVEDAVVLRIKEILSKEHSGKEALSLVKLVKRLNFLAIEDEEILLKLSQTVRNVIDNFPPSVELIRTFCEFWTTFDFDKKIVEHNANRWAKYLVKNRRHSESFECIKSVLTLCYAKNIDITCDTFFDLIHSAIFRNMAYETSERIINVVLMLTKFQKLNKELAHAIFSLEFMDKIDEEYGKSHKKTETVRINLMRLNRALHLLYPDFNVPWFHQKFCKEQNVKLDNQLRYIQCGTHRSTSFENGVFEALTDVLGDPRYIGEGVLSPYFHYIPFEIIMREGKPVSMTETPVLSAFKISDPSHNKFSKFAVFPRHNQNDGDFELISRELKTLGYTVISVQKQDWNSMKMNYKDSRASLLKEALFVNKR